MSANPLQTLQYERKPKWLAIRRRTVIAIFLSLALCLAFVAWWTRARWYAQTLDRLNLLLAQRACMRYAADPTCLVYSDDPVDVRRLGGDAKYSFDLKGNGSTSAMLDPECASQLDKWAPRPAAPVGTGICKRSTLFLHERTTRGGQRRLVLVEWVHIRYIPSAFTTPPWPPPGPSCPPPLPSAILQCSTLDVVGLTGNPAWANLQLWETFQSGFWRQLSYKEFQGGPPYALSPLRFFAGQIDPAHSAEFSIRCQYGKSTWFIDGSLEDTPSGEVKVVLTPRDLPIELTAP